MALDSLVFLIRKDSGDTAAPLTLPPTQTCPHYRLAIPLSGAEALLKLIGLFGYIQHLFPRNKNKIPFLCI